LRYREDERYLKTVSSLPLLSNEEWAYVAGIIDGEGSLTFNVSNSQKKGRAKRNISIQPVLGITNTHDALIRWLAAKIPNSGICVVRRANRKDFKMIRWWGLSLGVILAKVERYLFVKKPQCQLVQRYIELRLNDRVNSRLSEEEIGIIEAVRAISPAHNRPRHNFGKIIEEARKAPLPTLND